jgi:DNA-directed RNA polymerase subunit M/transcription elongation factor TFIIS
VRAKIDNICISSKDERFLLNYSELMGKIFQHIDPKSPVGPTNVMEKLISGELGKSLVEVPSRDLWDGRSKEIKEDIKARCMQKVKQKTSALYICGKCKKNQTIVKEVQLRSLDEACNWKITCVHCQHQWIH